MVDNLIKLFDSEETEFDTNGIGILSDAETCEITEERNGEFELEMDYPINGRHYDNLGLRKIIVAKSNPYSSPQPFRIYSISKPINGIVTINAEHISYDLSGYPVSAFSLEEANTTIQNVFEELKKNCVLECPFTFWTNKIATGKFSLSNPRSMRSLLAGSEGSIMDVYGTAEYEFDAYDVKLWMSRGEDKGVTIRYGKNLTDIRQEENCSSVYTAVYPYWYSETDKILVTLHEDDVEDASEKDEENNNLIVHIPDKIIEVEGEFSFTHILTLDLSDKFTERPTELELYKTAKKYIEDNDIGVPKVSIEVSFEPLSKISDYKEYAILEEIRLCDKVYVEFSELGVSATAKCIKTVYDVLSDKYKKIELGSIKNNLANTLSEQSKTLANTTKKSYVDKLLDETVMSISGNSGGYIVIHSSKGEKTPDEILIMDKPEIEEAQRIWRWNMAGLSYTDSKYSSFSNNDGRGKGVAITMDGKIVADFIAGNMIQGVGLQTAPDDNGEIGFKVTQDGTLTAKKGVIGGCKIQNGELQVTSANIKGTLTGHTIEMSAFKSKPIDIDGEKVSSFEVTENGTVRIRADTIIDKIKVEHLETETLILSGKTYEPDDKNSNFCLDNITGVLSAKNAVISGTIYANEGKIAGLEMTIEEKEYEKKSYVSKILRIPTADETSGSAFEVRVNEGVNMPEDMPKSSINIQNLNCTNEISTKSIYAKVVNAGGVVFKNGEVWMDDTPIIQFDKRVDGSVVTVSISCEWGNSTVGFIFKDENGNEHILERDIYLSYQLHFGWGDWSGVKTRLFEAGSGTTYIRHTGSFFGFDGARFTLNGENTLTFYDSGSSYVEFSKGISPNTAAKHNIGGLGREWNNLHLSGYIIDKDGNKFKLVKSGDSASLHLIR